MKINVFNKFGKMSFNYAKINKDIEKLFSDVGEVSLVLVNRKKIKKINDDYRHIDNETDVISFEANEDGYFGDIFICIDKVFEQAENYGHSVEREYAFLLVHGLLHLLGYDHLNSEDEKIMFAKQEELLSKTIYTRTTTFKELP